MLLSVVIPLLNEAKVVPELARRLDTVLDELEFEIEIVIIDDGSIDETPAELLKWQQRNSRLRIIQLSRNWGHQNAFAAGIDYAQGDLIVLMDGDLEDPPEMIPTLLKKYREGYDIVYTVKASRKQSFVRRILTNGYYWLLNILVPRSTEPQAGIFCLINRKVADALESFHERAKSFPNLRAFVGFKQVGVSYDRESRFSGRPSQTLTALLKDGLNAIFANTYIPLRLATVLGAFLTLLMTMIGLTVLFVRLTGLTFWIFSDVPGTQLIILLLILLGSFQIMFLGIIGEYIARLTDEAKQRPTYIVDKVIESIPEGGSPSTEADN